MDRIHNAAASLRGLALGDSFGQRWFFRRGSERDEQLHNRVTPDESPCVLDRRHRHGALRRPHPPPARASPDQDALADPSRLPTPPTRIAATAPPCTASCGPSTKAPTGAR
ncbi:hypothetical protein ACU686_17315 [Yinghuangia aomiensis]